MAESIIQLPAPTNKLRTWNRTIGANSVETEAMWLEDPHDASYTFSTGGIVTTTALSHLVAINAGATLPVRIRYIRGTQLAAPAAVASLELQLIRTTTAAPTGGTVITARPTDSADNPAGATAMTLPTVKATVGVTIGDQAQFLFTGAIPGLAKWEWTWYPANGSKPLIIPAGVVNGIAVTNPLALATASIVWEIGFAEASFV